MLFRSGWGVFIAPTTKTAVGEGYCRRAHRTVRCASHVTQPLGFDRWSSDLWGHRTVRWCTGQVLFTVPCAFCACSDFCARSPRTVAHCSPFTDDRWRASRCSRWHTGQSDATLDSPVNYSGAAPQIPEGGKFGVDLPAAVRAAILHQQQFPCPLIFPKIASSASSALVHRTLSGAPDQGAFWDVFCLFV